MGKASFLTADACGASVSFRKATGSWWGSAFFRKAVGGRMGLPKKKVPESVRVSAARSELTKAGMILVAKCIAGEFGVSLDDVLGDSRLQTVKEARHAVMRDLKGRGYSYKEVGRMIAKDHTTVVHAILHKKRDRRLDRSLPESALPEIPDLDVPEPK